MQNTLKFHGRDASSIQKITNVESIVYEDDSESDVNKSGKSMKSKSSRKSDNPTMSREECILYQMEVEQEKYQIMADFITSGRHA